MPVYEINDYVQAIPPYGVRIVIEANSADFPDETAAADFAAGVADLLAEHTNQDESSRYRMTRQDNVVTTLYTAPQ
jgi:hypothetical protein